MGNALMSNSNSPKDDEFLEKVDPDRRDVVRRILQTTAFAAPVVASFNLDGLTVSMAQAQTANGS